MASGMTLDRLDGKPVIGSDGSKIGTVADIYFDKDTEQPEWALVTTGMFGTKHSFVPITNASMEGDELRVPFTKDQVKDAPNLDDDGELSQDEEAMLARHYGMSYSEAPSDTGLPQGGGTATATETTTQQPTVGRDVSGPETDNAMTRSEEELRIGKVRRPSGLVRLRKRIVQEQVVVDKEVVPKERIRLDTDTVVEERQVSETVAREEITVEGDVEGGTTRR